MPALLAGILSNGNIDDTVVVSCCDLLKLFDCFPTCAGLGGYEKLYRDNSLQREKSL